MSTKTFCWTMALLVSNFFWFEYADHLWWQLARADGAATQAEHYIHNGCKN